MTLKFPPGCLTESIVRSHFAPMEQNNSAAFQSHLADRISYTAMGVHNPLRGEYVSKSQVVSDVFSRIMPKMDTEKPISAKVQNVLVCGDWATVELRMTGVTKGGLEYDHEGCWIVRYEEGVIVEARVYMDSALLEKIIAE